MRYPSRDKVFELFSFCDDDSDQKFPWERSPGIKNFQLYDFIHTIAWASGRSLYELSDGSVKRELHARCPRCGIYAGYKIVPCAFEPLSNQYEGGAKLGEAAVEYRKADFICHHEECYHHFSVAYQNPIYA